MTLYSDKHMRSSLERLNRIDPGTVADLAFCGPMEEPFCAVCAMLLPLVQDKLPGHGSALSILMYHDEASYQVEDDEDYMIATGMAGIFTYKRCLRVYQTAAELWATV